MKRRPYACRSPMRSAPTNAPRREPSPPSTTTTNASMMMNSPIPGEMARTGMESAPPRPASAAPRMNTQVKSLEARTRAGHLTVGGGGADHEAEAGLLQEEPEPEADQR